MSPSIVASCFCLFCYKSTSLTVTNEDNFENIKQFTRFLFRFSGDRLCTQNTVIIEQQLYEVFNQTKLLNCCFDCKIIIDEFCEVYHQLKCLELQLDLKINKLLGKMELSNRIPLRWTNINLTLQRVFGSNPDKIKESQDVLRTIRQKISNSGLHRSRTAFPRVLLGKNIDEMVYDSSHEHNIDEIETQLTMDDHDHSIEIKLEYPHLQTRENDSSISRENTAAIASSFQSIYLNESVYVPCEICKRNVAEKMQKRHFELCHDLSKVSNENQIMRCKADGCKAYFLTKRQLKYHSLQQHVKRITLNNTPSIESTRGRPKGRKNRGNDKRNSNKKAAKASSSQLHGYSYANCEICNRKLVQHNQKTHYETCHDISKVTHENQLARCTIDGCTAYFLRERQLKSHRKQEHSTGTTLKIPAIKTNLACQKCGKTYLHKWNLRRHTMLQNCSRTQAVEKSWQCKKCGMAFKRHWNLTYHMKNHSTELNQRKENFKCSVCGEMYAHVASLQRHWKTKHGTVNTIPKDPLEMPIKIEFDSNNSVASSVRPKATVGRKSINLTCSDCGKTWKSKKILWNHRRNVHLKHVCVVCGKELADKKSLEVHLKCVHKGSQKFTWECKECGKKMNAEHKLKLHMIVHTGEKRFSCHLCPELFSHRQNIKRHLRRTHGLSDFELKDTNLRPKNKTDVACKFCEKKFTRPWTLIRHCKIVHNFENGEMHQMIRHTDELVDNAVVDTSSKMETNDKINGPLEILPHDESDTNCETDLEIPKPQPPWIIEELD